MQTPITDKEKARVALYGHVSRQQWRRDLITRDKRAWRKDRKIRIWERKLLKWKSRMGDAA